MTFGLTSRTIFAACAMTAMAAPAAAQTVKLSFDASTDAGATPACHSGSGTLTNVFCTFNTQQIGSDYGTTAQLGVSYAGWTAGTGDNPFINFSPLGGNGAAYNASAGLPNTIGGMSSIIFTPAAGYQLSFASFDYLGAFGSTSGTFQLLDGAGNLIFNFTTALLATRTAYTANTGFFDGPITFRFGESRGVAIDNVVVNTRLVPVAGVPEPASWAMMIGGLGLVGRALRRRSAAMRFA